MLGYKLYNMYNISFTYPALLSWYVNTFYAIFSLKVGKIKRNDSPELKTTNKIPYLQEKCMAHRRKNIKNKHTFSNIIAALR